jgi:hypothetical protein
MENSIMQNTNKQDSLCREWLSAETNEALEKAFAGQGIRFPETTAGTQWDRLLEAIGADHASACVKWLAGESVYIPSRSAKRSRNKAVIELLKKGWKPSRIAQLGFITKMSIRQIQRIATSERIK